MRNCLFAVSYSCQPYAQLIKAKEALIFLFTVAKVAQSLELLQAMKATRILANNYVIRLGHDDRG